MKRSKPNLLTILALVALAPVISISMSGCGKDISGPEPTANDAVRIDKAQQMRAIFDKVNGDYSKLEPADKEAFIKLTGLPPDKAETWWVTMKYGLNGAPPGKGANGPK